MRHVEQAALWDEIENPVENRLQNDDKWFGFYLEEQCERNPLIIAVENLLLIVISQATLCNFGADLLAMLSRQSKSVCDPAVCIDDMSRNSPVVDTRNWITWNPMFKTSVLENSLKTI